MTGVAQVEDLERFRNAIARRLGLHCSDARPPLLAAVLEREVGAESGNASSYLELLETGSLSDAAWQRLVGELTVAETYFFRHLEQFEAFAGAALPARMAARTGQARLRILSAGCASGEEAYSLAILLRERFPALREWEVVIQGVDVNAAGLRKAEAGRYSPWSLRETPPEMVARWFQPDAGDFLLSGEVCRMVSFEERNLLDEDPGWWAAGSWDVVFCRNVLMYLTPGHAQALVRHLAQGLCPGGFLFLGAAETLRGLSQAFHLRHTHGSFYYQLAGARPAQALPEAPPSQTIWSVAAWAGLNDSPAWLDTIQQSAARVRELSSVAQASACAGIAQPAAANRWNSAAVLDLFRRERFGEALEQVSRRPPESAGDPDALLLEALLLTQQGRLEQARRTCRQLLEVDELNAQAHYVMGLCQAESWHHHKVAAYLDPSFAMPRLHLGLHARKQGQRETAHRELKQAIALLQQEDPARILLFGGGFSREALIALCRAEIQACGGGS